MKVRKFVIAVLALAAVAVATTVGATTASGKSSAQTIVIGAAVDLTSSMKPFDSPALAGAQIEAAKIAKAGGPKFVIKVCNHQLKRQQACAAQLVAAPLEACDDLAAEPAADAVRLHEHECRLDRHAAGESR